MKYELSGTVSIWNHGVGPMEFSVDHTEIVEALSVEEAIDKSLNSFTEEEEPIWDKGYPIVTPV